MKFKQFPPIYKYEMTADFKSENMNR